MIKGSVQEKGTKILTIFCTLHKSTSIHMVNTNWQKGESNSNTIIVGHVNTTPMPMDRSTNQKIKKET